MPGRIRFIRSVSRLQNDELALAFGVSDSAFKSWLRGTDPAVKNLVKIQEVSGFSLQWIATGDGPMFSGGDDGKPAPGFIYVPRYDVRASAGTGQLIETEQLKGFVAFREEWVRSRLRRNPANLVVVEAYGDSMHPTIADGDIMLVDISEERVRGSAIYFVRAGNEAIVKRIELKMDGSLVLKSDNPAYEPWTVTTNEATDFKVLGKVIWTGGVV